MFKRINLNGKTALVTGAGKGLGKACAIALAEAGAKVFIISRTRNDYKWNCCCWRYIKRKFYFLY